MRTAGGGGLRGRAGLVVGCRSMAGRASGGGVSMGGDAPLPRRRDEQRFDASERRWAEAAEERRRRAAQQGGAGRTMLAGLGG